MISNDCEGLVVGIAVLKWGPRNEPPITGTVNHRTFYHHILHFFVLPQMSAALMQYQNTKLANAVQNS